jgi:hypothetical protein
MRGFCSFSTYPSVENSANWNGIVSAVGLFSYFQYTGDIRDNRTDVIMLNMHLCQMSMRDIQCVYHDCLDSVI